MSEHHDEILTQQSSLFFGYPGAGRPHHVAIYIGGDKILHAPRTGDAVRYGTIGEFAGEVMTVRRIG